MRPLYEESEVARPLALIFGLYFAYGAYPVEVSTVPALLVALASFVFAVQPGVFEGLTEEFDPSDPRHGLALLLLFFGVWVVVLRPMATLVQVFWLGGTPSLDITSGDLVFSLLTNLAVMVGTPLAWTYLVEGGTPLGSARRLGFEVDRPAWNAVMGVSVAFLSLAAIAGINYLMVTYVGLDPENPLAGRIVELVDLKLAFFVAAVAALGEETFFRGFLQPKIGLVPASILFAVGHSSYGVASQLVGPLLFGILLGWLYRETETLVAPIVSHFTFNFTVLFVAIVQGIQP